MTTEQKMQDYLMEVFDFASSEDGMIKTIDTFEDLGMMTTNSGIVLKMRDNSEFQLQIIKSK